jgi:hypothetical protein
VSEIISANINDAPLLDMLDSILQEIECYDKLLQLREELAKKNPSDQPLTAKLF